ncbi:MAG: helix-turn-helix transcriptional regulator [Clostridia bacterium]|nr:helix-turn-helix transcriptional regulator [Clostridia bacterium]
MEIPIGQNIRRMRLERGMTQRELAHYLSISIQAVSKWENDRAFPDVLLLPDIAKVFGVTLDELFRGEDADGEDASQKKSVR